MLTLLLTFLTFAVENLLFCWYVKQEKQVQMLCLTEELPGSSVFFCMKKNS